jgi:hypothetical protein
VLVLDEPLVLLLVLDEVLELALVELLVLVDPPLVEVELPPVEVELPPVEVLVETDPLVVTAPLVELDEVDEISQPPPPPPPPQKPPPPKPPPPKKPPPPIGADAGATAPPPNAGASPCRGAAAARIGVHVVVVVTVRRATRTGTERCATTGRWIARGWGCSA